MNNKFYLEKNKILYSVVVFSIALFSVVYGDYRRKLYLDDVSFSTELFSIDNLYNEEEGRFTGEVISQSELNYQVLKELDGGFEINNTFTVKKPSGEAIFSVQRIYGVNDQGKHIPGAGDKNRIGYLFGPKGSADSTFSYWHINYNQQLEMQIAGKENIYGIDVIKYEAYFVADQTNELSHLAGVPEKRGVELDVYLELWIEPELGRLVKYEDYATAWFYDKQTKQRINPWNSFHNEFRTTSILKNVRELKARKLEIKIFSTYIPLFFLIIGSVLILGGFPKLHHLALSGGAIFMSSTICLIGLLITYLTLKSVNENHKADAIIQFESNAREIISSFQNEIDLCTEALEFLRYQYLIADTINKDAFNATTKRLLNRGSSITAIGWVPLVYNDQRSKYEAEFFNGQSIMARNDLNELSVSPKKDHDFPITLISPYDLNKRAVSFDLLSREATKETIAYARLINSPSCTPPVQLVQEDDPNEKAVIIMNPVKNNAGDFKGFFNGVVGITRIKNIAISRFSNAENIKLQIVDVTKQQQEFLYNVNPEFESSDITITKNLPLKGRIWKFNFYYADPGEASAGWYIIFGGIFFSLILAYLIYKDLKRRSQRLDRVNHKLELYTNKLKEKNKDLEQFIFIASHDLQEPTQSIRGFINLLEEEEADRLSENGRSYIEFTKEEASRMHSLVRALGDYIRIGKDKTRVLVDMQTISKLAMVHLKREIEEIYPKITIDEMPVVRGIETELEIVWLNLINNALKFRQAHGPLQIHLGYEEGLNNHIFFVKDNGMGIAKEHHEKVFEMFRKLHLRKEYPGNGMGLAVCKKVLENHEGRIWVESEAGFGATFYFSFPKDLETDPNEEV